MKLAAILTAVGMIVNAAHWDQRIYQVRVSEEDADTVIEVIQVVGNRGSPVDIPSGGRR